MSLKLLDRVFTVLGPCVYEGQCVVFRRPCGMICPQMTPQWPPNHPKLVPGDRVLLSRRHSVYNSWTACLQCSDRVFTTANVGCFWGQCGVIGHRMTPYWPPNSLKLVPGDLVFTIVGPCVSDAWTAFLQCSDRVFTSANVG